MPSCQILLRPLQLLVQLSCEIVITVIRFLTQRLIDGKINFQLVMAGRAAFDMIEKLFQFPIRQLPVQIRSDASDFVSAAAGLRMCAAHMP